MYSFTNFNYEQPDFRPIRESGKLYRLSSPAIFNWTQLSPAGLEAFRLTVPVGFLSDGLSASRAASLFGLGRDGIHRAAVCVHDYFFEYGGRLPEGALQIYVDGEGWVNYPKEVPIEVVNLIFKNMLERDGVKSVHRFIAYWAVRLFGKLFWKGQ